MIASLLQGAGKPQSSALLHALFLYAQLDHIMTQMVFIYFLFVQHDQIVTGQLDAPQSSFIMHCSPAVPSVRIQQISSRHKYTKAHTQIHSREAYYNKIVDTHGKRVTVQLITSVTSAHGLLVNV